MRVVRGTAGRERFGSTEAVVINENPEFEATLAVSITWFQPVPLSQNLVSSQKIEIDLAMC